MIIFVVFLVWAGIYYFRPSALAQAIEMEREGLLDKAVEFYNEELSQNPENIGARLSLANIMLKKKYLDAAQKELELILKITNNKPFENELTVYMELAKIYEGAFKKDSEYMTLLKIYSLDSSIEVVNLKLADYCIGNELFDRSLIYLSNVLETKSAHSEALYNKGMVLIESDRFDEGLEILEALIKVDSQYTSAYEVLGYIYMKKDSNKAIKYFRIVKGLSKELYVRANSSVMLSYLYSINKNWKKVVMEVESHLAFIKSFNVELSSDIYFVLGVGSYFMNNDVKAEEYWRELVKINFKFMDIYEIFQLRKHSKEGDILIMDFWHDHFGTKTYRKVTDSLATNHLSNMTRLDNEFRNWLALRGEEGSGLDGGKLKKSKTVINNHIELSQIPIAEFKDTMDSFVNKIGYSVESLLESKDGFDAIIVKDMKSVQTLFMGRNWTGIIGEIPVKQMIADMNKMDYRKGIMVVCGEYSDSTKKLAEENNVKLVSKDSLDRILKQMK